MEKLPFSACFLVALSCSASAVVVLVAKVVESAGVPAAGPENIV